MIILVISVRPTSRGKHAVAEETEGRGRWKVVIGRKVLQPVNVERLAMVAQVRISSGTFHGAWPC